MLSPHKQATVFLVRAAFLSCVQASQQTCYTLLALHPKAAAHTSTEASSSRLDDDEFRYSDSSGELTLFDEPSELQQQSASIPAKQQESNSSSGQHIGTPDKPTSNSNVANLCELGSLVAKVQTRSTKEQLAEAKRVRRAIRQFQESSTVAAQQLKQQQQQQQQQQHGHAFTQMYLQAAERTTQQRSQQQQQIIKDLSYSELKAHHAALRQQNMFYKDIEHRLAALHALWAEAQPPSPAQIKDALEIMSSYTAAVTFSAQYQALVKDLTEQQHKQQSSIVPFNNLATEGSTAGNCSTAEQGSTSAKGGTAATDSAAETSQADYAAWARNREAVLMGMKLKQLKELSNAYGLGEYDVQGRVTKAWLAQFIIEVERRTLEGLPVLGEDAHAAGL